MTTRRFAIAVHGGAGRYTKEQFSADEQAAYHQGLTTALHAAEQILSGGGAALDAVEAAVVTLENDPLFNAGRGAVLDFEGKACLDAAIMDGATRQAGSVAALTHTQNPVRAARAVMDHSPHVLLAGPDADAFAASVGLPQVDNAFFITQPRVQQLAAAKAAGADFNISKFGTVGAVACDRLGNIAAATSTGGMTNKRWGRIGDTPIIGAGTYADNENCAVSATGHGEFFMRVAAAHKISALMEYMNYSLADAVDYVLHTILAPMGGEGGIIAVDSKGNLALDSNTSGMFRGSLREGEGAMTGILRGA